MPKESRKCGKQSLKHMEISEDETYGTERTEEKTGKKQEEIYTENSSCTSKSQKTNFGETVVLSANIVTGPATLVSREPGELATIYLQEELTVIGKMETAADAVIDLPTVSRIHAKIRKRDGEYYLTDIISWGKTKALKVNAYILENSDEIYGINSRLNLAQAAKMMNHRNLERYMINGVTIVDPDSTWISEDTEIGQDSIVYPFTYIEGKNTIGKSCKIGPCAHFRGNVEVCDNVKVGNFVEVKKAKISSNTNVGHLSYIGDSELGEYVNIGAGTITANYNPLTKEKTKTILKDNVKIGSNTVLVAPITVDEGANIGAGTVVTKDIPAWALGITRSPLKILENWVKKKLSK